MGIPQQPEYQLSLAPMTILNSFVWFTLWSVGWVEFLVDFVTFRLQINPNLYKYYPSYILVAGVSFLGILGGLVILVVRNIKKILADKLLILFGLFYLISLSTFVLFPWHKFTYYLSLPVVIFSIIVAMIIAASKSRALNYKIIVGVILVGFLTLSWYTIQITGITHWSAKRAGAAQDILTHIKQKHPSVLKGSTFYITNDPNYPYISADWGTSSKQAFFILSGSDAFRLLYKDPTINVYFEDMGPKVQITPETIIYPATFRY